MQVWQIIEQHLIRGKAKIHPFSTPKAKNPLSAASLSSGEKNNSYWAILQLCAFSKVATCMTGRCIQDKKNENTLEV